MLTVQICFSVILIIYAFSENTLRKYYRCRDTPKVFNHIRRMRQKSLGVHSHYGDFRVILLLQNRFKICQKYFCVHRELIRRIRQEYFAVHGENANRHKTEPTSANCRPKQKIIKIPNHFPRHDWLGKKHLTLYCSIKDAPLCRK